MANYINRVNSDGNVYQIADTTARENIAAIEETLGKKVDKVDGKGLSTNDLTNDLKNSYDSAVTHSKADHARTDATAVAGSNVNGNIVINGIETTVYAHPEGTNPHGTTKDDLGLNKVENFKAVSTEANQGLSHIEQENARENIGAGTSSFSGNYSDLIGKPDALPASDVYDWAKEENKPSYTPAEVGLGNVGNYKAVSVEAGQSLTNVEQDNARTNIGAQVAGNYANAEHEHRVSDIVDFPTALPASDVPAWAKDANKPSYTPAEVGLGSVGNYKAVSVETIQSLSSDEKQTARTNIGAQVAGDYANAEHDHTVSEIVDFPTSLPASDVPAWAKEDTKPAYTPNEVGLGNVGNFKAVSTESDQGLSEEEKSNARANIGVQVAGDYANVEHDHTVSEIVDFPTSLPASDVPAWAKEQYKPAYTPVEVGLGNVGNYKAVSTVANQELSDDEKSNARTNIGAQVAGDYADSVHTHAMEEITDLPELGTAAIKDVATSGNASTTQVVMGNDTRLTDARKASDVSAWAKASTKPTYTADEVGAIAATLKGVANGVAELDAGGKVPASQLPSYVDDVVEGYLSGSKFFEDSTYNTEIPAVSGKIYVDLQSYKTYRWTGSTYAVISETISLGETSSTAYRGDRGAIAYTHSQADHAPANAEKNQNAFSNVKVGTTTIAADTVTDTVTLVAGSNVTITANADSDTITIEAQDTVYTHPSSHAASMITGLSGVATSGSYNDLSNKPSIPSKTSELTNDSGFKTTDTNTTYSISKSGNTITLTGSDGSTTTVTDSNTTYSEFVKSGSGAKAGLVPAPSTTEGTTKYLREDGTWVVPPNTTYSAFGKSGSGAKAGLVPAPSTTEGTTKYLREDGTWATPPDTNTTYTLSSFGITATATELNYTDGVTSNIQTQLNGKADASHGTHVTFTTTAPAAAGTASAGSASTVSRSDHVHAAQTTISGNAGSATKLETARTFRTNLGSTNTASFDGSANATPGVTGTLALGNGGTGATTAAAARTNLGLANTITIAYAGEDDAYNVTV